MDDDIPDDLIKKCHYCSHSLDKEQWNSEWGDADEQHYKTISCGSCGKKNTLDVSFYGSGHDRVFQQEDTSLESVVRKVQEQ